MERALKWGVVREKPEKKPGAMPVIINKYTSTHK